MSKKKRYRGRKGSPLRPALFLVLTFGLLLFALWAQHEPTVPGRTPSGESVRGIQGPTAAKPPKAPADTRERPKIAILIDDIGQDLKPLDALLRLDAPIAFAVLPFCRHSAEAAGRIQAAGREVLLHLPMEPQDFPERDPGKGALLLSMSDGEIREQLERNLRAVPFIRGVNNHMGSRFMEDRDKLRVVFEALGERHLFFVDSRTTASSRAAEAAAETGIAFAARAVFIDADRDRGSIVENVTGLAGRRGDGTRLIVIGHPYPETIAALKVALPRLRSEGVDIVEISGLIRSNGPRRHTGR